MAQQAFERLSHRGVAAVGEGLGEKARIQQVQHGVFDAANVQINRQPMICLHFIQWRRAPQIGLGVVMARIAGEIPARLHERVHGVGFAPRRLTPMNRFHRQRRAIIGRGGPRRMTLDRIAFTVKGHIAGQRHRQILFGQWHCSGCLAIDVRNRVAPIALTTDAPIA